VHNKAKGSILRSLGSNIGPIMEETKLAFN